jgi:central kinetochore subunit Mis15/CHL4
MAPTKSSKPTGPLLPSTSPLPSNHRLPSTDPTVLKALSPLSRAALLDLAAQWCSTIYRDTCGPYIDDSFDTSEAENDAANPWSASTNVEELEQLYRDELGTRRGTKRDLLDRILEGDWRHGISLLQMAMAETRCVLDSAGARRWSALEIYNKQQQPGRTSPAAPPKLNAKTFVRSIHAQLAGLTKAHYHIMTPDKYPLTMVRLALYDSPYNNELLTQSKTLFLAFPHNAPAYVYVAKPSAAALSASELDPESSSIISFIIKSVGPALSRPGARFALRPTNLTAKSLDTLLALRGAGGGNAAGGGWSIFADGEFGTEVASTLDVNSNTDKSGVEKVIEAGRRKKRKSEEVEEEENQAVTGANVPFQHANPTASLPISKRTRLTHETAARFGVSSVPAAENNTALTRFDVRLEDALFPNSFEGTNEASGVKMSFSGKDVFAGIRALTEIGVIRPKDMPGWLTGEGGVSVGTVREGRLEAWDGGL